MQHKTRTRQPRGAEVDTAAVRHADEVESARPAVHSRPSPQNALSGGRPGALPRGGAKRRATYTEPQQVGDALWHVMADATPEDVQRLAKKQGMEVSGLVDKVVYASMPAPSSHPLVSAK